MSSDHTRECPKCLGDGEIACSNCHGAGVIDDKDTTCPSCHGEGMQKCSDCDGTGYA